MEKMQVSTVDQYDKDFRPVAPKSREEKGDEGGHPALHEVKRLTAVHTSDEQRGSPSNVLITALESQDQPTSHKLPATVPRKESIASPAVTSLKRLSVAEADSSRRNSQDKGEGKRSFGSAIKSLLATSDAPPRPSKQAGEVVAPPIIHARRRSSASEYGDNHRPRKEDSKAPLLGLSVPATIMLRKATGLLGLGVNTKPSNDVVPGESPSAEESPLNSPTAFTLVGFDSRHASDKAQSTKTPADFQIRRQSTISILGLDEDPTTSFTNAREVVDSRRSSLAAPAMTFTNTFPSTAIMTSPVTNFPPASSPDHRFSVVQIKSRNSLHQIIWREDDTPSDSGASSEHPSPTGSFIPPNASENSPTNKSSLASEDDTRQSSEVSLCKDDDIVPDPLIKIKADSPPKLSKSRPENHMHQWSWGADHNQGDSEGMIGDANPPQTTSFAFGPPFVPQLLFPGGEEETSLAHHELGINRRGSFMVSTPSATNLAAGRELGSRRSISVQPFMLSSLPGLGVAEDRGKESISRRLSRVG